MIEHSTQHEPGPKRDSRKVDVEDLKCRIAILDAKLKIADEALKYYQMIGFKSAANYLQRIEEITAGDANVLP